MANSIDFGTLAIGTLIGIGCKKQLRAAAKVGANLASSLATTAAVAVNAAAAEIDGQAKPEQPDQKTAQNGQANGTV